MEFPLNWLVSAENKTTESRTIVLKTPSSKHNNLVRENLVLDEIFYETKSERERDSIFINRGGKWFEHNGMLYWPVWPWIGKESFFPFSLPPLQLGWVCHVGLSFFKILNNILKNIFYNHFKNPLWIVNKHFENIFLKENDEDLQKISHYISGPPRESLLGNYHVVPDKFILLPLLSLLILKILFGHIKFQNYLLIFIFLFFIFLIYFFIKFWFIFQFDHSIQVYDILFF